MPVTETHRIDECYKMNSGKSVNFPSSIEQPAIYAKPTTPAFDDPTRPVQA